MPAPIPAGTTTGSAALASPWSADAEEVARRLDGYLHTGLSTAEAARRLAQDGPKELHSAPPVPTWRRILAQFQDPLIYLLLGAIVISAAAWPRTSSYSAAAASRANASPRQAADGSWEIHGAPREAALLVAERKLGIAERRARRFDRIREPLFTSERKMMSTIKIDHEHEHEHDDQMILVSKGAPDALLKRCGRMRLGMEVVALDESWRKRILADANAMSDAALRTLAVAIARSSRTSRTTNRWSAT